MSTTLTTLVTTFFIALGVILGGSVLGAVAGFLSAGQPPFYSIVELAERLKIWALVSALGGSFAAFRVIEIGFLSGQPAEIIKQLALIICAFGGSHLGYILLKSCFGGN
jgi:hypothetical protein